MTHRSRAVAGEIVLLMLLSISLGRPAAAHAQGCSMCRDTTAGSAPRERQALRRAIPLLGVPAIGIFAAILIVAKRAKPGGPSE